MPSDTNVGISDMMPAHPGPLPRGIGERGGELGSRYVV